MDGEKEKVNGILLFEKKNVIFIITSLIEKGKQCYMQTKRRMAAAPIGAAAILLFVFF